jgi:anaerobic magnesium-protoporphyrin IX monomethyl ester cyclase
MTTFGCPFNCDFCSKPIFGNDFRRKSGSKIISEIENILGYGYDSLWIGDDNFTLDERFVLEFCQMTSNLDITWSCLSRTTGVKRIMAEQMKSSGCDRVYLGLESGSQATLDLMNKKTTIAENTQAVDVFSHAGINVSGFFLVGYPGETRESIEKTFRFALSLPIDNCSFSVPFPLPGSNLFKRVVGLDPLKDWAIENENTFIFETEIDRDWLTDRIREVEEIINSRNSAKINRV